MQGKVLYLTVAGISMISAGTGMFVGYYLTKQRLEEQYDIRLKVELHKSKEFYTKLSKRAEYSDPVKMTEEIIKDEHYDVPADGEDTEAMDSPRTRYSPFDYTAEELKRKGRKNFVISFDEMKENPKDYDQRTFTYYEKDDVLVDERDTPIDDIDGIVGLEHLDQFGYGSNDPNIVYVRNDFLSMDFEIIRDFDSYEETVLGSIKHSDHRRPKKFRIDDD